MNITRWRFARLNEPNASQENEAGGGFLAPKTLRGA